MSINRADATLESSSTTRRTRGWAWIAAAAGLALAITLAVPAVEHLREPPPAPPAPLRLSMPLPEDVALGASADYPFGLALAPDGRRAVYPAARDGAVTLWLQDLTTGSAAALPGTDTGLLPFWSPDGQRVAFFANGRLRAFHLQSARIDDLAEVASAGGGAWLPSGDIIVALQLDGGLMRYHAADRRLTPLTTIDRTAGESSHRLPTITTDGAHIVFYVVADRPGRAGLWLAALDHPAERVRLTGSEGHGTLAGDALFYAIDGSLMTQRLDPVARALAGQPVLVATRVGVGRHHQLFASAASDSVVYAEPASGARELTWTDRTGRALATLAGPVHAWDVRIAPDGQSVAMTATDPQLATLDIWVYDGGRPLPRRLSPALDVDDSPIWAPDATRLAWVSARTTILVRGRQAMLPEDRVRRFDGRVRLWDWSRAGQLVLGISGQATGDDLWMLDARGDADPRPYVRSPFNDTSAAISPDGRWLAFASDESGRSEIYVDRFPRAGRRVRITGDGGVDPRWRGDGGEIVFRRADALYAIAVRQHGDDLEATATARLFDAGSDLRAYDMTRDGQRFLLNRPMPGERPPGVRVLVNWRQPAASGPPPTASR